MVIRRKKKWDGGIEWEAKEGDLIFCGWHGGLSGRQRKKTRQRESYFFPLIQLFEMVNSSQNIKGLIVHALSCHLTYFSFTNSIPQIKKVILRILKNGLNLICRAQVVGWPPVRSFRKNIVNVQRSNNEEGEKSGGGAAFVKVSMDGAPYLRKVDIRLYKSYQELSDALAKMFSSFTIQKCGSQGTKDFMNETKLIDLLNGSDYVPTYEDKDGDWMLVGDVPWESVSFILSFTFLSFTLI